MTLYIYSLLLILNLSLYNNKSNVENLRVLDIRNESESIRITCSTLQGLVNRNKPRLYLIWPNDKFEFNPELKWLEVYKNQYGINHSFIDSPKDAILKFKSEIQGYVVYDPEFRGSINIATTIAFIENAIVVAPMNINLMESLGIKKIEDLRNRWKRDEKVKAFSWAFSKYWDKCNHSMLASMEIEPNSWCTRHHIRDYLVANKVFSYNLSNDFKDKEETNLIDTFQKVASPLSLILGWRSLSAGPTAFITRNAMHGNTAVCCLRSPNLSVHSQIKPNKETFKQCKKHSIISDVVVEDKVYITFMLTDGDALHVMLSFQGGRWFDSNRDQIPFSWGILPLLAEFAPGILEYYYRTKKENEYFVTGLGIGYTYLGLMPDNIVNIYFDRLSKYMKGMDLRVIWGVDRDLIHYSRCLNSPGHLREVMTKHKEQLPGLIGVLSGFPQPDIIQPVMWIDNKIPIVTCKLGLRDADETHKEIKQITSQLKERPLFLFIAVGNYTSSPTMAKTLIDSLNPDEYEVVLPDEFLTLVKKSRDIDLR